MLPHELPREHGHPVAHIATTRKKETKGIEHRIYHMERVPTIILMRDNIEVGRITESVEKNIQSSLQEILEKI